MALSPRDLPSVDRLVDETSARATLAGVPRDVVVQAARETLATTRTALRNGEPLAGAADLPALVAKRAFETLQPVLRPVINATGVIVHTNLGRAPLSQSALEAAQSASLGYSNLEYDLALGERGSRHELVTGLIRRLTGAADALVVNNNAAAVLLALSALAAGREAIIARGQLVEIGGGFRIPDVMRQSGATLVEVGSTNRTYVDDYLAAVTERSALFLHVHASNFLQVGFTHTPNLAELVQAAAERGLPVIEDLGSGALVDTSRYGLAREPTVRESIQAGVGLVAFSGDKLLGGPQAGILAGRADLVRILRRHPLTRAVRPDKLTLAALGATLLHYLRHEEETQVPVIRMLATPIEHLRARAERLAAAIGTMAAATPSLATVGGGALPGQELASFAVALDVGSAQSLAAALRIGHTPVIARVERDLVLLDLRTVAPADDAALLASVRRALGQGEGDQPGLDRG